MREPRFDAGRLRGVYRHYLAAAFTQRHRDRPPGRGPRGAT
jgi:hypothetical protein